MKSCYVYDGFYVHCYFENFFLVWKGVIWEFLWALILLKIIFSVEMFVWGLYDDYLYKLFLLKIIFSMKRYYVYVWEKG